MTRLGRMTILSLQRISQKVCLSKDQNSYGVTGSEIADKSANYVKFWLRGSRDDRLMDGKTSRI